MRSEKHEPRPQQTSTMLRVSKAALMNSLRKRLSFAPNLMFRRRVPRTMTPKTVGNGTSIATP